MKVGFWRWKGVVVGLLICTGFSIFATIHVWPPLDGDGAMLFPPAVELARGKGFVNTPMFPPMDDSIDPTGMRRHISHGFLNQFLVGTAAKWTGGDSRACIGWLYAVLVVGSVACAIAFLSNIPQLTLPSWLNFLTGLLSITGFFALSFAWFSRPEPMVLLWVGCALLALRFLSLRSALFFIGFFLGLMGLTSPLSALTGGLFFLLFAILNKEIFALPHLAILGGGLLTSLSISFLIYPYSIMDWVGGNIRHSRIHFDHKPFTGLLQMWVLRPHLPLLIVSVFLLVVGASRTFWTSVLASTKWQKISLSIVSLILLLVLFRLLIVRGEAGYNVLPIIPILAMLAARGLRSSFGIACLAFAFFLPSLGLSRSAVLLASQARTGPEYLEVRDLIRDKEADGILVSKGLWMASPNLSEASFGKPLARIAPKEKWFIDQQLATGRATPLEYHGYKLVQNKFSGPVRLLGIPISNAPTGWQYALYEKVSDE